MEQKATPVGFRVFVDEISLVGPRSGSLGERLETTSQSLFHTQLLLEAGTGFADIRSSSYCYISVLFCSHFLYSYHFSSSLLTVENFKRAPVIFQEPLSSENISLRLERASKSTIKEAFCSTPMGTAVLTKSGLSSLAFISNGATSLLPSEPISTILQLSFYLNNFGAAVLNFLRDSLT